MRSLHWFVEEGRGSFSLEEGIYLSLVGYGVLVVQSYGYLGEIWGVWPDYFTLFVFWLMFKNSSVPSYFVLWLGVMREGFVGDFYGYGVGYFLLSYFFPVLRRLFFLRGGGKVMLLVGLVVFALNVYPFCRLYGWVGIRYLVWMSLYSMLFFPLFGFLPDFGRKSSGLDSSPFALLPFFMASVYGKVEEEAGCEWEQEWMR